MAPDAQLYLVNFGTDVEYKQAVLWLKSQDVDIISFSMGWHNAGPYDGTGEICETVEDAYNSGILWVSAVGDDAQRHYEGTFIDTEESEGDYWHEFTSGDDNVDTWVPDDMEPGDETIEVHLNVGDSFDVFLSWDDWKLPGSDQDYDLFLFKEGEGGLVEVALSWDLQDGSAGCKPTEAIYYVAPSTWHLPYSD